MRLAENTWWRRKNVLIPLTFVKSVQVLDCENSAWIDSIHWLAMHGLNSLLLSEVELEREAAHLPFLSRRAVSSLPPREEVYFAISTGFLPPPRFLASAVSRVPNTNRDVPPRELIRGLCDHYH